MCPAEGTGPEPSPLEDAEPNSQIVPETDGFPLWVSPIGLTVLSIALLFASGQFVFSQRNWLIPFFRDFRTWVASPEVGGGFHVPAHPVAGFGVFLIAISMGWLAARMLLRATGFADERPIAVGLSLVLGISLLGYAGMLGLVLGELSPQLLWSVIGAVGGALLAWNIFARKGNADAEEGQRADDLPAAQTQPSAVLRVLAVGFAVAVISLIFIHASMGPVQEWDSVVYHAESARQWFMERPDPPLLYGPSVGIQISSNYPPLFPATGAAIYTLLGVFDDFYLRLVSPGCLVAVVLMTFGYARARFGPTTAYLSLVLTLGAPLLILYGTWPTSYLLLGALLMAVVILSDGAATSGSSAAWVGAGSVAGLAILSQFYGLVAVPIGIAAALVLGRRRSRSIITLIAAAVIVSAPWLIRNFVELGDPVYPLGSPLFEGKGLVEPIWEASKEEIRTNALAYWPEFSGPRLFSAQLGTILFDRHLIAPGLLLALIGGIGIWSRERRMLYLVAALSFVPVLLLLQGWFWVRALVPIIPLAALLTGQTLWIAMRGVRDLSTRSTRVSILRPVVAVAIGVAIVAGGAVTMSLATAGPNQETWTTGLSSRSELMRAVRNLGSTQNQLWSTFAGDMLMWEWLDEHAGLGRTATLEIRTYYLDQPEDLFFLDGLDAVPLLRLADPAEIFDFLNERGVRFVALPSWTTDEPTRHPVLDLMPIFEYLGSRRFPAIAAFGTAGSERPSVVYSVGPSRERPSIGIYPGGDHSSAPLGGQPLTIAAGRVDPRIFVPVPKFQAAALSFDYATSDPGGFQLHLFDDRRERWDLGKRRVKRSGVPGWDTLVVPIPPTPAPVVDFGINIQHNDLTIRNLRLVYPRQPLVQESSEAELVGATGRHVFAAGSVRGRIYVPVGQAGATTLEFKYLDQGTGDFDINILDPLTGTWRTGVKVHQLEDSGTWRKAEVQVFSNVPGFVEVGVFVRGVDLMVEGIDLRAARGND